MAAVPINMRVLVRDEMGRFAERLGEAVDEALEEAAHAGAESSATAEPKLARTFRVGRHGKALYDWHSTHPWAEGLNDGIPAHRIPLGERGYLAGKAGERHREADFYSQTGVNHPGVEGRHFMEAGYEDVKREMPAILRRHKVRT